MTTDNEMEPASVQAIEAIARIRARMAQDTRGMTHDGSDQGTAHWWVKVRYDDLVAVVGVASGGEAEAA